MNRDPIYQTFSTRVLVPVRRRSRLPVLLSAAAVVALVLAAVLLGRGVGATQTGTGAKAGSVAGPDAAREDLLRRYAEQTPVPTQTPAPAAEAVRLRVAGTEGVGLLLRDAPGFAGTAVATLDESATVELLGDQVVADGLLWAPVRDAQGGEGWVAADYLQPA
jgi:hypothetical protein